MVGTENSLEEKEPYEWNEFMGDIWHKTISTPLQISQPHDEGALGSSTLLNDLKCDDDHFRSPTIPNTPSICTPNSPEGTPIFTPQGIVRLF